MLFSKYANDEGNWPFYAEHPEHLAGDLGAWLHMFHFGSDIRDEASPEFNAAVDLMIERAALRGWYILGDAPTVRPCDVKARFGHVLAANTPPQ